MEALVATGIFIMVAVALAGVWAVYGSALSKSADVLAANQLARGVAEGLIANGYDWLVDPANREGPNPPDDIFVMERMVRTRTSNVVYNIRYRVVENENLGGGVKRLDNFLSDDVALIRVRVRWRSDKGSREMNDGEDYNNEVAYSVVVYRGGIN